MQEKVERSLSKWLEKEEISTTILEIPLFRNFIKGLNEDFVFPDEKKLHKQEKQVVQKVNLTLQQRILHTTTVQKKCIITMKQEEIHVDKNHVLMKMSTSGLYQSEDSIAKRFYVGTVQKVGKDDAGHLLNERVLCKFCPKSVFIRSFDVNAAQMYILTPISNVYAIPPQLSDQSALQADKVAVALQILDIIQQKQIKRLCLVVENEDKIKHVIRDWLTKCTDQKEVELHTVDLSSTKFGGSLNLYDKFEMCLAYCRTSNALIKCQQLIQPMGLLIIPEHASVQLGEEEKFQIDLNSVVVNETCVKFILPTSTYIKNALQLMPI
jgi:hypothetical protein